MCGRRARAHIVSEECKFSNGVLSCVHKLGIPHATELSEGKAKLVTRGDTYCRAVEIETADIVGHTKTWQQTPIITSTNIT